MATGLPVHSPRAHEPDALEAAGWSELLDEAVSGEIVFPLGALRLSPTPAMTLFDVDGAPPLDTLAIAAAHAVARDLADTVSAARSASISRPSPARRNAAPLPPRSTNHCRNRSSAPR
ncbi:hypothetical protein [Sphingomonas sp. LR55]|uniref:hypothetical protein n=1 Tax=Sphingomonas sp. LR55 TaxID=3050231 RepID=UPI003FA68454